jgi:CRP-like cAMP-binding protein
MLDLLSADDQRQLLSRARTATFRKGERLQEGEGTGQAVYVIRRGLARIEHEGMEGIGLVRLGPGDLFGDLPFQKETPGHEHVVIVEEDVESAVLDEGRFRDLLHSDAALAARVYGALAATLARKLRAATDRLAHRDVGLARPRHARPIPRGLSDADLPLELQDAVDHFEVELTKVERQVKLRDFSSAQAQVRVNSACDALAALLATPPEPRPLGCPSDVGAHREGSDPQAWAAVVGDFVFRRTFPLLMLSTALRRCEHKPRGKAVDFETLEHFYRNEAEGNGVLGPYLDRWFLDTPLCRAYREGRALVAGLLREAAMASGGVQVTALGCAASEALDLFRAGSLGLVTCIDDDREALEWGRAQARKQGCLDHFHYFLCDPVHLALGLERVLLPPQQMIYALGMAESLDDDAVVAILDWAHGQLADGGRVVLTNLDPSPAMRAFLEQVLEWKVTPRDEDAVRALFRRSRLGDQGLEVRRGASGGVVLGCCAAPRPGVTDTQR